MTNSAEDPMAFVKFDVPELTQVRYSEITVRGHIIVTPDM